MVMRYRIGGKQREMGLGGAGAGKMPLVEARAKAERVQAQLRNGIDPLAAKMEIARVVAIPTFHSAMNEYISRTEPSWKNQKAHNGALASKLRHASS